jgi:tetratricopeptide (TPR) repeat protein
VLFSRGDYAGASRAFSHAVSAATGGPNDFLKWANWADALRWVPGQQQAAHDAYLRASQLLPPLLARAPDDPVFLTRMGLYTAHLADPAALDFCRRGVNAAPHNPDAHFRAAVAHELAGRRDEAIALLRRAVALGYPVSLIESEPELTALRRDFRYQTLAMENTK